MVNNTTGQRVAVLLMGAALTGTVLAVATGLLARPGSGIFPARETGPCRSARPPRGQTAPPARPARRLWCLMMSATTGLSLGIRVATTAHICTITGPPDATPTAGCLRLAVPRRNPWNHEGLMHLSLRVRA